MISFIVALVFFMEAIDGTALNTAIPAMAVSFHVNPLAIKMALISYLLSLAVFIPISGWLADRFGVKRVFISAVAIFTFSSWCCGFAQQLSQMILWRLFQGMGASITMPVGRLILLRTFGRERLVSTMSTVVMVGALGFMFGPLVGGFLTQYFSWHWIFWINVPIGIGVIIISWQHLKYQPVNVVYPFDILGFILFALALSLFTFGFSLLSEINLPAKQVIGLLLLSLVFLLAYSWHSHQHPYPIVNTQVLRRRTFLIALLGNIFLRLGFSCVPFLLPLMLQIPLHFTPHLAGMLLAPMALGVIVGKPLVLPLLRFIGYKYCMISNAIFLTIMVASFAIINAATPVGLIALQCTLLGLFISMQFGGLNSLAYADITPDENSAATSIMSTIQALMQSFSISTAALFIRLQLPTTTTAHSAMIYTLSMFHRTFYFTACFMLIPIFIFTYLNKNDGAVLLAKPMTL